LYFFVCVRMTTFSRHRAAEGRVGMVQLSNCVSAVYV
jgi:hypothetical protein